MSGCYWCGVTMMSAGVGVTMGAWVFHRYERGIYDTPEERDYRHSVWVSRIVGPVVAALGAALMVWGGA